MDDLDDMFGTPEWQDNESAAVIINDGKEQFDVTMSGERSASSTSVYAFFPVEHNVKPLSFRKKPRSTPEKEWNIMHKQYL